MDRLAVQGGAVSGRRRALSVNSITEQEQTEINQVLETLQSDLTLIDLQWKKTISQKTNPLQLALSFLDETSVGLGYRYQEFQQLNSQLGSHLQEVVNHYNQAFNENVASYTIASNSISESLEKTSEIKHNLVDVHEKLALDANSLKALNKNAHDYNEMLRYLSKVEELLQLPDSLEENVRNEDYFQVQKLLERGYILTNDEQLQKYLPQLGQISQQIDLQEHILFQNIMEELNDIIYSKKGSFVLETEIMRTVGITQNGFTSLENYLFNIANIDIVKRSERIKSQLKIFVNDLKNNPLPSKMRSSLLKQDDTKYGSEPNSNAFQRILIILTLVKDINRLPTALSILNERTQEEIHNIILSSTENVRVNHLPLLKMAQSMHTENYFGLSVKDLLSIVLRECFWVIFTKMLLAAQYHRVIHEIINVFQGTSTRSIYKFDDIWKRVLSEIETLLSRYINNPLLLDSKPKNRNAPDLPKRPYQQLFTLKSNLTDISSAKSRANELQSLLKDIFPGFNVPSDIELDSLYIKDQTFEQEEALIPPSVFNMKLILEPFLLFVTSTSDIIPQEYAQSATSSLAFFKDYINDDFFPKIELTLDNLFVVKVESKNPHALETVGDNTMVFKTAIEFQDLFYNILHVMSTTTNYRKEITTAVLNFLQKGFEYYQALFNTLVGVSDEHMDKKVITTWLEDPKLMNLEESILNGQTDKFSEEIDSLLEYCPNFYQRGKGLSKSDAFATTTLETLMYFVTSLLWMIKWIEKLGKAVDKEDQIYDKLDPEALRKNWSFFESENMITNDKSSALRISLNATAFPRFERIVNEFKDLKTKIMCALRFDVRALLIWKIGDLFQHRSDWKLNGSSVEVDSEIASLISELRVVENRIKQQLPALAQDQIFLGIESLTNKIFIKGAMAISVMNKDGANKMLRDINSLQLIYRHVAMNPETVKLDQALEFYALCEDSESELFRKIESKGLDYLTKEDMKNILRLQFSEDLQKQNKTNSSNSRNSVSYNPLTKRYNEAVKRISTIDSPKQS